MAFQRFKITDKEWLGNQPGVGWAGHEHLFEGEHKPTVMIECGCGLSLPETATCPICGEGEV